MRLIDIYREVPGDNGNIVLPVTTGCVQTDGVLLTRTPNNKFYEMSDGTCACYPCATAKAESVLELECTEAQADAIDAVTNCGSLLFAGIRCGTEMREALHPPRTGYRAFLTGQIEIEKMFACANVYRMHIPLRFDVSGEEYRSVPVPVICPDQVTIGGTSEPLSAFDYRLIAGEPVFVLRNTILTGAETLILSVSFFQANSEAALTGCTAIVRNSAVPGTPVPLPCSSPFSIANGLVLGSQALDIEISKYGLHPLRLRLPVYRQAVST